MNFRLIHQFFFFVNVNNKKKYLNLINFNMLVRFLHVFEAHFHGVNLKGNALLVQNC